MKTRAGPLPDRWTWLARLSCVRRLLLACRSLCLLESLGSAAKPSTSTSAPGTELAADDSVWLEVDSCCVAQFDPARSTVGAFSDRLGLGVDVCVGQGGEVEPGEVDDVHDRYLIGAVRSKRRGITVEEGSSADRVEVEVFQLWALVEDESGSVQNSGAFRSRCPRRDLPECLRDLHTAMCRILG